MLKAVSDAALTMLGCEFKGIPCFRESVRFYGKFQYILMWYTERWTGGIPDILNSMPGCRSETKAGVASTPMVICAVAFQGFVIISHTVIFGTHLIVVVRYIKPVPIGENPPPDYCAVVRI